MNKQTRALSISVVAIVVLIGSLFCVLSVQRGIDRNDKLLSGKYDTILSRELDENARATVEAIIAYQRDHGQNPSNIDALIPDYAAKYSSSYMGGRLVYDPEPWYGVPFYFGFRRNYSGLYFMHGCVIAYCPVSICTIPHSGTRRIDDTWLFIHSSAF